MANNIRAIVTIMDINLVTITENQDKTFSVIGTDGIMYSIYEYIPNLFVADTAAKRLVHVVAKISDTVYINVKSTNRYEIGADGNPKLAPIKYPEPINIGALFR